MKKLILLSCLLILYMSSSAQKNYTVVYSLLTGAEFVNGKLTYDSKLQLSLHIYDDTLSFCRYGSYKAKMSKKVSVLSRDSHHGTLHHLKSDSILEVSTFINKCLIKIGIVYNWKILNDTATILGIKCIKAESELGMTAWFAPSKPVNAGPSIYYGLPGLILKVVKKDRNNLFIAESIQNEVPFLDYPNNIKIIRSGKL